MNHINEHCFQSMCSKCLPRACTHDLWPVEVSTTSCSKSDQVCIKLFYGSVMSWISVSYTHCCKTTEYNINIWDKLLCCNGWKQHQNLLIFDEVTDEYMLVPVLWLMVYMLHVQFLYLHSHATQEKCHFLFIRQFWMSAFKILSANEQPNIKSVQFVYHMHGNTDSQIYSPFLLNQDGRYPPNENLLL